MAHDLQRFVDAQNPVYEQVVRELGAGRKRSHWMWFVFPQAAGLGASAMSQRYAIASLDEARAYLAHPVLGRRLRECAQLVLNAGAGSAEEIFGGVDAVKLASSMTLFDVAEPGSGVFDAVLDRYCGGGRDQRTLDILGL